MSKPTYILGISAFYHDSSACLIKNGTIVAAAQEERFSRIKHDKSFPELSISFCLENQNIDIDDIAFIAYYEKPILKFDRILTTYIKSCPKGFLPFKLFIKSWLSNKLWVGSTIKKELNYKGEIRYCRHHESHASAAYYTSPFKESAFLTIDGVGEEATTTIGIGIDNKIKTLQELKFPHSLGLLYSAFTYYCGFKVNSGEYKLMGLAPYGTPKYVELIKNNLVQQKENGSFQLNMEYFAFHYSLKMISEKFNTLFGAPPRQPEESMSQFYKDVAASIQKVTEEIVLSLAKHAKEITQSNNLCLAGGVALNCVANSVLEASNLFENIWIFPSAGDGGTSAGAALQVWHQHLEKDKKESLDKLALHSYLGPSFSNSEIKKLLEQEKLVFDYYNEDKLYELISDQLSNKAVVGWFSGKSEFGPRALGNRSIIASPKFPDMQKHLNLAIKKREGFRPFAPVIMEGHANEWFETSNPTKTMLYTYQCKQPKEIPACVHVDGSSRVQTVNQKDNPRFHSLLSCFHQKSGIPVLINTSFNVRGEPMVNSPMDAIKCFFNTEMDILVLENYVLTKHKQSPESNIKYEQTFDND